MASSFKPKDEQCENCGEDNPVGTFRVEENKKLCNRCSIYKEDSIKTHSQISAFICVKHREETARLFCESHKNAICTACAATDTHKSCSIKDIQDAVDERKKTLADLEQKAKVKIIEIKDLKVYVSGRAQHVANRLNKVEKETEAWFMEKTKYVTDTHEQEASKINQEADEQISIMNKARNEALILLRGKVDDKLNNIETEKENLIACINVASDVTEKVLREATKALENSLDKLVEEMEITTNLMANEKCLLSEADDITIAVKKCLETSLNMDKIGNVSSIVDNASFLKLPGDAKGAVAVGEFILEQEEELPLGLDCPTMLGTSDKNEVVFTNKTGSIHVKNVDNKTAKKVLKGKNQISTCTSLNDGTGRVVCGTDNSQVLVYNKKWELIRTFNLASKGNSMTLVCASKESLILSAISGENTICVLDPDDGRLVKVNSTEDKPVLGLRSLQSGYVAMTTRCTDGNDVCILDESGEITATNHFHNVDELSIAADIISDCFYVVSRRGGRHDCALTIMSSHGVVTAKTPFKLPYRIWKDLNCTISASGKLVMNTANTVLVFNIQVRSLAQMMTHIT